MTNRTFALLLAFLLVVNGVTRLMIVDHRLPDVQVVDENSDLSVALRLLEGELPSKIFRYHRVLTSNVDLIGIGGLYGYHLLTGKVQSVADFQDLYYRERWQFTVATRLVMSALMLVAVGLTALTGRYISNTLGILAAGVLTVNGFFTQNSVYAMPDTLVIFAVALYLWLLMRLWHFQRRRDYLLMGMAIALVMLAKLSATFIGGAFIFVHAAIVYQKTGRQPLIFLQRFILHPGLWLAGVATLVFNVIFNPVAFIRPDDLIYELRERFQYGYGFEPIPLSVRLSLTQAQILDMIVNIWRTFLPVTLVGMLAVLWRYRERVPYMVFLIAWILVFIPIAAVATPDFPGYKIFYWSPILPPLALLTAVGILELARLAQRGGVWRSVLMILTIPFFLESWLQIKIINKMQQPDTRELAYEYALANWTSETRIMSGDPVVFSVPFKRNATSIQRALDYEAEPLNLWYWWRDLPENQRPWTGFDLYSFEVQAVIETYDDLRDYLIREKIEYYITADLCNGAVHPPDSESALLFPPNVNNIADMLEEVIVFSPFATDECLMPISERTALTLPDNLDQQLYTGPLIRIYRVLPPLTVADSVANPETQK